MEIVPQMDTVEEARSNKRETLQLLEKYERNFLEIGRLLNVCDERCYWKDLGAYKNFKDYIQRDPDFLDKKIKYNYARGLMNLYKFSTTPEAPPRDILIKIGRAKLVLLARKARKDKVPEEVWSEAVTLTHNELLEKLRRYKVRGKSTLMSDEEDSRHRVIQAKIQKVGTILGRYAEPEYGFKVHHKPHRCDVVWKDSKQAPGATHVFEVHCTSPLLSDLSKLSDAYENLGNPLPFLIVLTPEDRDMAYKATLAKFPKIYQSLIVLTEEEIDRCNSKLLDVLGILKLPPIEGTT